MTSRAAQAVQALLEKMNSPDADFRYMALSDLMAEANKETLSVIDDRTQTAMVVKVLDMVRDQNGEVKNMSVKCLGTLVKSTHDKQLQVIMDKLVGYVSSKEEDLRDIASLALKTVISQIPVESGQAIMAADKLVPRLLSTMSDPTASQELMIDSLDVLGDYFSRFAHVLANDTVIQHSALKVLLGSHSHKSTAIRKRSNTALSALAVFADSEIFTKLSEALAVSLSDKDTGMVRTTVQLLGMLAKTCPRRLGRRLPEFLPRIMAIMVSEQAQEDDELREVCLQALDSIVLRCPAEMTPFVTQVIETSVDFLRHDPNYAGDDDSDDDMEADNDDSDDDENDLVDEENYSDDEDLSWKVRRSSARLLSSIIVTRSELLPRLASVVAPALVLRFAEREETVRNEVLQTFSALLQQAALYGALPQATEVSRQSPGALKRKWDADATLTAPEGSPINQIRTLEPAIVKAVSKAIVSKAITTRLAAYAVLRDLIIVLQGGLDEHIGLLVGQTSKALKGADSSSGPSTNLKSEVLGFLQLLFRYHKSVYFEQHLSHLTPFVASVIGDKVQRETIEGFRVTSQLCIALRPIGSKTAGRYREHFERLYVATMARLTRSDSDQEIKEKGIATLGDLLAHAGDDLDGAYDAALPLLIDRLNNETTRLAAVKAVGLVATSTVCQGPQMNGFASEAISAVVVLLRKNSRTLRAAAFECLNTLLARLGTTLPETLADQVVLEIEPLVVQESNLNLFPAALHALDQILYSKRTVPTIQTRIVPPILTVLRSPLLQGPALLAILTFFGTLVFATSTDAAQYILTSLDQMACDTQGHGQNSNTTQVFSALAQCMGAVAKAAPTVVPTLVERARSALENSKNANQSQKETDVYCHLLLVGELARFTNFSNDKPLLASVLRFYEAESDEVKSAAAFAMGNMAVGNLDVFLPIIEAQMNDKTRRLLALHALKELIAHGSSEQLVVVAERIWTPLFAICATNDESVRNIGAECLARLTLTQPAQYLTQLQARIHDPEASIRASVIAAVRYTLTDATTKQHDELLAQSIVDFLQLLQDESLDVRKPAMFAFNAAAHNKPVLIRDHLPVLLPMLYQETVPRQELLRKVAMGPFTVVTDDGLDLRKNAFETMYTLLDTCFSMINLSEYIERVIAGLRDEDGIKVLSSLMLVRLAGLAPTHVAQHLDAVVEPITSTLKVKLKDQATKQDVEKSTELQRSLFRAMVALNKTPHAALKFQALVRDAKQSSALYRDVEASFQAAASSQYSAMDLDG